MKEQSNAARGQRVTSDSDINPTPHSEAPTRQTGADTGAPGVQFGEVDDTGQGTDLTEQMDSVGPQVGNTSAAPGIPWNPQGKLDDLVERRTAGPAPGAGPATTGGDATMGSPKGGGTSAAAEDAGAGRYGGDEVTPSPTRYAGASDDAPTSPEAGATTTLASLVASDAEHTMREDSGAETDALKQHGGGSGYSEVF